MSDHTKLGIAVTLLSHMAPEIARQFVERGKTQAGVEELNEFVADMRTQLDGEAQTTPHVFAVVAYKLASDLVGLAVEADKAEAAEIEKR